MKQLAIFLLFCAPLAATIGDNAPAIPAGYIHDPSLRMDPPDNAFLDVVWNGGTMLATYANAANGWNSATPVASGGIGAFRRLVIAYLSTKRNAPANPNVAIYLQKIKDMALLAGTWPGSPGRIYSVTDLSASGSGVCTPSCTAVTTAGNFLTGCSGGTCVGKDLGILSQTYAITAVSGDGKTITMSASAYQAPNGSGLYGAVIGSGVNAGNWFPGLILPLAKSWVYNDLDTATRDEFERELNSLSTLYEAGFSFNGPSPFNDNFFLSQSLGQSQTPNLLVALAAYDPDDTNAARRTEALGHLRYAMDVYFNILLPAWRKVIGGGCLLAENDAGTANSGTATRPDCGGAWHEGWSDYVAGPSSRTSMNNWYVTYPLAWWKATGDNIFQREGWIKNAAYWTMYCMRPDFTLERIGANKYGAMQEEHAGSSTPGLGMLDGLAMIYNAPTLKGWAVNINWHGLVFDNSEPSAWPYFTPLAGTGTTGNVTTARNALSKVRHFPGVGIISIRTGWSEDDAECYFKYTPFNYWSHPIQDAGAWACFKRGALAIRSGGYFAGEIGYEFWNWTHQLISQNAMLIYDPADRYTDETYALQSNTGATVNVVIPNDGGGRRVGSRSGSAIISTGDMQSPADVAQLMESWELYQGGKLLDYVVGPNGKWVYAAVDITRAYNNTYSHGAHTAAGQLKQANTSNRSFRAQKVVRHFVFAGQGTDAWTAVYTQVISANASFVKKDVIHMVNSPAVTAWDGSRAYFTATRNELVTARPDNGGWMNNWSANLTHCPGGCTAGSAQYQYDGRMYTYVTLPAHAVLTTIGGAGHEFEITDGGGTTNWNQCMLNLCPANAGLGGVVDQISSDPTSGPKEVGGCRVEVTTPAAATEDWFLQISKFTTTANSGPTTLPSTTLSGTNYVTTWVDNNCTYTLTLARRGVDTSAPPITATGVSCATPIP